MRLTNLSTDKALFKVPTLRNLSYTSPYMHDGSISSLENVIEHYSNGIQAHENLSDDLPARGFSKKEKAQLMAFLLTLNDHSFIAEQKFKLN